MKGKRQMGKKCGPIGGRQGSAYAPSFFLTDIMGRPLGGGDAGSEELACRLEISSFNVRVSTSYVFVFECGSFFFGSKTPSDSNKPAIGRTT